MRFTTIKLTGRWNAFMQNPPTNMRIMLYGEPKNGKTSGAFQLAGELSVHGKVLYNLADQGFNPNTQELIRDFGLVENRNIGLSSTRSLDELAKQIREGNYQFVFIDMISNFKVTPEEMEHFMKTEFPNVGFVLVFASTKSGNFAGGQDWAHLVDVLIEVKKFVAYNTGRYGSGEFYIWPEKYPPPKTQNDDNN